MEPADRANTCGVGLWRLWRCGCAAWWRSPATTIWLCQIGVAGLRHHTAQPQRHTQSQALPKWPVWRGRSHSTPKWSGYGPAAQYSSITILCGYAAQLGYATATVAWRRRVALWRHRGGGVATLALPWRGLATPPP